VPAPRSGTKRGKAACEADCFDTDLSYLWVFTRFGSGVSWRSYGKLLILLICPVGKKRYRDDRLGPLLVKAMELGG